MNIKIYTDDDTRENTLKSQSKLRQVAVDQIGATSIPGWDVSSKLEGECVESGTSHSPGTNQSAQEIIDEIRN